MRSYRFGPHILEVEERRLLRDGEPIALTPKVFDTLVYLVEHQGHLVGKDELMQAVWNDSYVEDGSLPRTIHVLRKALGNGDDEAKYIETVPTKGYRFVAPAKLLDEVSEMASPDPQALPTAREPVQLPKRTLAAIAGTFLFVSLLVWGWRAVARNGVLPFVQATDGGEAYMSYQFGRVYMERHHTGDYARALENFEAATRLDPHYADAFAGIADAEFFLYWESGSHDDIARARLALDKAIELNANNPYAHTLRCRIRATYDWDFAGAESDCRRAIELDPKYADARRELAFLLNALGKRDDALREMEIAVRLAPSSFNKRSKGLLLYFARHYDEAIAQLSQVEQTDREYSESSRWIARCFEQKKQYEQALEYLIRFRQREGAGSDEIASLRTAYARGGWTEVLRATVPKSRPKATLENAGTFAQLGEKDVAFHVLEGMIQARRVMIVHMDSDPRLDPLRSDARYEVLARRVGLR